MDARPRRRAAGFTIVEMLVAMTVTLILVVALMRIFTATANTWQRGEAQVDAYREARGALQLMARDLSATMQAASVPLPTPTPSAGGTPTTASATNPLLPTLMLQRSPDAPADLNGPGNEELYCLTNIPNPGSSTLCSVGYYCRWMPGLSTNSTTSAVPPHAYALMRQSLATASDGTFLRIRNATQANPNNPLTFLDLYADTGTNPAVSVTPLATYVWDLRFRIDTDLNETTYPDGNAPLVPKDHSLKLSYQDQSGGGTGTYPNYLPPFVEIRFKALSAAASRRLEGNAAVTQSTWRDTDPSATSAIYQSVIRPNLQQFILRVPLNSATPQPTP